MAVRNRLEHFAYDSGILVVRGLVVTHRLCVTYWFIIRISLLASAEEFASNESFPRLSSLPNSFHKCTGFVNLGHSEALHALNSV